MRQRVAARAAVPLGTIRKADRQFAGAASSFGCCATAGNGRSPRCAMPVHRPTMAQRWHPGQPSARARRRRLANYAARSSSVLRCCPDAGSANGGFCDQLSPGDSPAITKPLATKKSSLPVPALCTLASETSRVAASAAKRGTVKANHRLAAEPCKLPTSLYRLKMTPDANVCVSTSSRRRAGVPSANRRLPVPSSTG